MKNWAKKLLVKSHAVRVAMKFQPRRAAILTYHSVREEIERDTEWIGPGITHSCQVFSRQMELITKRFHPVPLDDIVQFVKGEKELPEYALAVTFDDGFLDNVEVAASVLNQYGIPAAFYLTVGLIGTDEAPWYSRVRHAVLTTKHNFWNSSLQQRTWDLSTTVGRDKALMAAYDVCAPSVREAQRHAVETIERELEVEPNLPRRLMMNWEEARALRATGHVVGSHTVTHPNVAHIRDDDVRRELSESKRVIEKNLGQAVDHFSYPHPALTPQWNERTVLATQQAGYVSAVTTTKGAVREGENPLTLRRINAPRADHEFLWNLERALWKN